MRFEVPQFIDVEDKIFGPLTWRQFVYLGGGLGVCFVTMFILPSMIPAILAWIIILCIGIPLALLAGALAFFPVNNRPFSFFLEAVYNYLTNTKLYLWKQKSDVVYKEVEHKSSAYMATPVTTENRGTSHTSITSLTRSLELQALQKPDA